MNYTDYFESVEEVSPKRLLEQFQENERRRLETELRRIDDQLERRDELHEEAMDELVSKRDWYIERLETLYKRAGRNRDERDALKQRIEEFYEAIRTEKRQHWRDRQKLQRERREVLRELDEVAATDLLDELL